MCPVCSFSLTTAQAASLVGDGQPGGRKLKQLTVFYETPDAAGSTSLGVKTRTAVSRGGQNSVLLRRHLVIFTASLWYVQFMTHQVELTGLQQPGNLFCPTMKQMQSIQQLAAALQSQP